MRRIPLATIELWKPVFGDGYWEDCLRSGQIEGTDVVLTEEAYQALQARYTPRGLGDRLATILRPIAAAIDVVLGTDLKHCDGCAARQAWLNRQFPSQSNGPEPHQKPF